MTRPTRVPELGREGEFAMTDLEGRHDARPTRVPELGREGNPR